MKSAQFNKVGNILIVLLVFLIASSIYMNFAGNFTTGVSMCRGECVRVGDCPAVNVVSSGDNTCVDVSGNVLEAHVCCLDPTDFNQDSSNSENYNGAYAIDGVTPGLYLTRGDSSSQLINRGTIQISSSEDVELKMWGFGVKEGLCSYSLLDF
jgi:hypothetical protein